MTAMSPLGPTPSEIGVPETVMMPPGVRVWESMTKAEEGLAV